MPPFPNTQRSKSQGRKKPSVLPTLVSLLQRFLDRLLRVFSLTDLLERVVADHPLQSFQLQRVSCRHKMIVVDHFDERLDFAALLHSLLAHATCDFGGISLNACDESVWEWMLLCSCVHWLYDDDLDEASISMWEKASRKSLDRWVRCCRTFFPAYLPRVMMATRPTLRTGGRGLAADFNLRVLHG
jgi:hypothetical protein